MRKLIFWVLFFIQGHASAQPPTTVADTSFSTYSAYDKAVKIYPGIQIVEAFHSKAVAVKKDIVYCTSGKRKLLLDVFYPSAAATSNGIAVIIIHGGGWRSGNRAQHYPLAQRLASLGYTCFTPEYRLSAEALYPAAVIDIRSAIRWIKLNAAGYPIDTSKIAALGFSAGGELAAFVGATGAIQQLEDADCNAGATPGVQAIVDIDGTLSFVHPESAEGDDSKKRSAATQWLGVAKKDSLQLWKAASPLTYVNEYTPPMLFINSGIAAMHAGREDCIKILEAHNIYSEIHSFENAPHTFCLFHPWFEPMVGYIDSFLEKCFK
jgi:pectinesterase